MTHTLALSADALLQTFPSLLQWKHLSIFYVSYFIQFLSQQKKMKPKFWIFLDQVMRPDLAVANS